MQFTENLNLNKPELSDNFDITKINDNMDAIDERIGKQLKAKTMVYAESNMTSEDDGVVRVSTVTLPENAQLMHASFIASNQGRILVYDQFVTNNANYSVKLSRGDVQNEIILTYEASYSNKNWQPTFYINYLIFE